MRISSRKHRALLTFLALNAPHPVPMARVCHALWGDNPPESAVNAVQVHISAVRRSLGPAAAQLRTDPTGYRLDIDADHVDALRAERLVARARAGAAGAWREAAALWRGDALVDVIDAPYAEAAAARFSELRLTAIEGALEADLTAGRHQDVVAELESLVAENPYREGLTRQLMLALYRSGRQADALAAYRRLGEVLVDDLGIDPGPAVAALERAVLTQDPALDLIVAPGAPGTQLPEAATVLIGRDSLTDEVVALVRTERLVTLLGPGGVGKTRVALEAARRVVRDFADGVAFVDMSDVRDPGLLVPTVAAAVGAQPTQPPLLGLVAHFGASRALIVLDNLEQILDAAGGIAELLRRTAHVHVLATSRVALRLSGEYAVPVPPLDRDAAKQLFVALSQRTGRRIDPDAPVVEAICERLDRLPLALTLAAAQCRVIEPAALLQRLERELPSLAHGHRDLPDRHRKLDAAIAWSVELLGDAARDLFTDLGVFGGSVTLDAAEQVHGCDVLESMGELVDASLVQADGDELRLLQTVRDHARRRLQASGRATELENRYAAWVTVRVDTLCALLHGAEEATAANALRSLLPDLRAVMAHHIDTGRHDDAGRLLVTSRRAWYEDGAFLEVAQLSSRISLGVSEPTAAAVTLLQGIFAKFLGDESARQIIRDGVDRLRRLGTDRKLLVNGLCHLADLEAAEDERDAAFILADEAVALARLEDTELLQMALDLSAYVASTLGDHKRGIAAAEAAVAAGRAHPTTQLANGLAGLAASLAAAGRIDEAVDAGMEAFARARELTSMTRRAEIGLTVAGALGAAAPEVVAGPLAASLSTWVALRAWPNVTEAAVSLARAVIGSQPERVARLLSAAAERSTAHARDVEEMFAELERRLGGATVRAERLAALSMSDDEIARLGVEIAQTLGSVDSATR